jgi:hypothetical protein
MKHMLSGLLIDVKQSSMATDRHPKTGEACYLRNAGFAMATRHECPNISLVFTVVGRR